MSDAVFKNSGRQLELDYLKALAIVFMILVHTCERFVRMEIYIEPSINFVTPDGIFSFFLELTGIAAMAFMFCLGIGIVFSKRSTAKYLFKRSLIILAIAMFLRIFVDAVPLLIYYFTTGDASYLTSALEWFLADDILNFAFLAFLFFAFVKLFKLNNIIVFAIAVILLIAGWFVPVCFTDCYIAQALFGWIFWQNDYTFFPFAQWIIYPVCGYLFGQFLIKLENKDKFYFKTLIATAISIPVLTIVYTLCGIDVVSFITVYLGKIYDQNLLSVIWVMLIVFFVLSLMYFVSKKLNTGFIPRLATNFSKKINTIYCTQWLIIGWAYYFIAIPFNLIPISYLTAVFVALVIITAAYLIASKYLMIKEGILTKHPRLRLMS